MRFKLALSAFITIATCLPSQSEAAENVRKSVLYGVDLMPVTNFRRYVRCEAGESLVGVGTNHIDRMVGYWYRCARNNPDGSWISGSVVTRFGPGQVRRGLTRWHDCPRNYYIVGLGATAGTYLRRSLWAQAEPPPILADIQPLCRLPAGEPHFYQTTRAYFEGADDNKLYDIPAMMPDTPKSCPRGTVAVGILFAVDFRRDIAVETQFQNAALICDRLNVVIDRGLGNVPGQ